MSLSYYNSLRPSEKGIGNSEGVRGLRGASPPPKGIVIIIITNVGEMSVPARHKLLQENERESLERTE